MMSLTSYTCFIISHSCCFIRDQHIIMTEPQNSSDRFPFTLPAGYTNNDFCLLNIFQPKPDGRHLMNHITLSVKIIPKGLRQVHLLLSDCSMSSRIYFTSCAP